MGRPGEAIDGRRTGFGDFAAEGELPDLDCRGLLDALPSAVVACGRDGRVVYANRALEELLGWGPEALIGGPLARLFAAKPLGDAEADSAEVATWLEANALGRPIRVRAVRAEGGAADVEVRFAHLGADDPGGFLVGTLQAAGGRGARELERERSLTRLLRATTKAAAQLGSNPAPVDLTDEIARVVVDDFEASSAAVWLAEPSESGIGLTLVRGGVAGPSEMNTPDASAIDPALDSSALGGAARSRRPTVRAASGGFVAAFPLLSGGTLLGVLEMEAPGSPDAERIDAATTFAALAAATLNDARVLRLEREARAEAEANARRLASILDAISVGVILAEGREGRISLDNRSARQILGDSIRAGSLKDFLDAFPMEGLDGRRTPDGERPFTKTFQTGERIRKTLRYRRPDGRAVVLDLTTAAFPGPDGGAISTFADVTERHRLESELAERAGQLRALLDHLPVGVAYFDPTGTCRAGNGLARRVLGSSKAEIVGVSSEVLLGPSPKLRNALRACIKERASRVLENVPWEGDRARFHDWRFEPLPSPDPDHPRGAMILIVDVTERAEAAFALQRTARAAVQASARKTQFLSAVSHDLRTPVNALSLQGELLSQILGLRDDPDAELLQLAEAIRQVAANLIELINDLLDLTRFDSGGVDVQPVEFSIEGMLRQTLAPLETTAHEKGLEFSWSVEPTGRYLRGDRVQLGRVLTNLAGNAVKFTDRGRIEVRVWAEAEGGLSLSVRDTGVGIPPEGLDRVFDEFAQLRNPERDRTKGTGLGLAICRRLVEGVGGWLAVESELGVGSAFTAHYPAGRMDFIAPPSPGPEAVTEDNGPPASHPQSLPKGAGPSGATGTSILVVEDDPNSRKTLARLLAHAGHVVAEAPDGAAALALLESAEIPPALILLDLMMPGLDGRQVLKALRGRPEWSDLKVVLLTGDTLTGRSAELAALNVDGFLAKPIDLARLLELVARLLPPGANP